MEKKLFFVDMNYSNSAERLMYGIRDWAYLEGRTCAYPKGVYPWYFPW